MRLLKTLFGLLLLAGLIQTLRQVVPPVFNNFQFEDAIRQEAHYGAYSKQTEQDIREKIFRTAKDLDIPITREQIRVQKDGQSLSISASYKVGIDVPFYPFELSFRPASSRQ
ncbi:MAG: hypothetical protein AB7O65_12620 [Candidatus Korobacteraceae bacterium]